MEVKDIRPAGFAIFQLCAATAIIIIAALSTMGILAFLAWQDTILYESPAVPLVLFSVEGAAAVLALLSLSRHRHRPGEWVLISLFRATISIQIPLIPCIYAEFSLPPPPRPPPVLFGVNVGAPLELLFALATLVWLYILHRAKTLSPAANTPRRSLAPSG